MTGHAVAGIVFICVFAGALGGLALRTRLPDRYFDADPRDAMALVVALVSTVAAMVLSLLANSSSSLMNTQESEIVVSSLFVGALVVAGALLLVVELRHGYTGLIQISSAPLKSALAQIGR